MALVSPGLQVTVTDESQYVSTSVGTVPFILLATAQDKTFSGTVAPLTTKENAGKLLAVTGQRDLITGFGTPIFKQSASGSPVHGDPLNEYGLMAAYSALGACNRAFIIRADIDLNQLEGTTARPIGDPVDNSYWLSLIESSWGVFEWDAELQTFENREVEVLTSSTEVNSGSPIDSVGVTGGYAIVATTNKNELFYKAPASVPLSMPTPYWVKVGSAQWQNAVPALIGAPVTAHAQNVSFTINGTNITTGANLTATIQSINDAAITGVRAEPFEGNRIAIYVMDSATSDGLTEDGIMLATDVDLGTVSMLGLSPANTGTASVACPTVGFGTFAQVPDWRANDSIPRPTGSVWIKTSVTGSGANIVLNQYDASSDLWEVQGTPMYAGDVEALAALDPAAGGNGITAGTLYVRYNTNQDGTVTYQLRTRTKQGATVARGVVPGSSFSNGNQFRIYASSTSSSVLTNYLVTIGGTGTVSDFAAAVLAANVPDVVAKVESDGSVSITHKQGGVFVLEDVIGAGTPLLTAGFTSSNPTLQTTPVINAATGTSALMATNFSNLAYTASESAPYTEPVDGTLWFYNSAVDIDIMINETDGWKGYRTVANDARGYNLQLTDVNGPIVTPSTPTTQSDGVSALVKGDLWVDTGDLANFPAISRWNGDAWVKLDNSDQVTQNGVAFADMRWDTDGTSDTAAGAMPSIADLALSNHTDIDAPDYRLFPRGILMVNLRRSGFNVKRYVKNYFNENSFPDVPSLPVVKSTWVTASGLKSNGSPYAGADAQRVMVVKAMRSALDLSDMVREDSFQFNLLCAPGFPELISNLVQLNADRKETGFIIGDTPMDLKANVIDLTNWSTNATGEGLSTASPYLGVFYPSGITNDLSGNTIMVPPSHMVLRAAIKSDSVSYPWFAFAGTRRGLIDNATDVGYIDSDTGEFIRNGLKQGLRDALYPLNINPVTLLPGVGLTNFGNKTRIGVASALDRINVARLVNYLRTIFARVGDGFLFEPNDAITRNQIKQIIESALNDLIAKRGIYDYVVVCDDTNNDPGRIARNELYVDIAIEPMKDVEFIYIPIRLKNPGDIAAGV